MGYSVDGFLHPFRRQGQRNLHCTLQIYRLEESEGENYSSTSIGTQSYTYVEGEDFVPYEDTEAFENIVVEWLEESLDVPAMQASIAADIESQITPKEEKLSFTWQNTVPPEEEEE